MSLKRLPTRADTPSSVTTARLSSVGFRNRPETQEKLPVDGPNGAPSARIVAIDLDLLAPAELVGRVVVLPRSAADVHVVGRNGGLVREGLLPANWGCQQDVATQKYGNQQTHRYASRPKTGLEMRTCDKIATMQAADL